MQEPVAEPLMATPDVRPSAARLGAIRDALKGKNSDEVRALVGDLMAPDLADLIELLDPDERVPLIRVLGPTFDPEALSELEPSVRDQLS